MPRTALAGVGGPVRSFHNASASCTTVRLDGYAVHAPGELRPARAFHASCRGACRSARLLEGSSFAACAKACLAQPFCEAVTWISSKHDEPLLRGTCWGRTSGTPNTFLEAAAEFDSARQKCAGCTTDPAKSFVAGIVSCGPCDLQKEMDALCTRLGSRVRTRAWDNRCGRGSVARNEHTWTRRTVAGALDDDYRWACYPLPQPGDRLSLGCVDGRGKSTACAQPNASACSRPADLHDLHRNGCGTPSCLAGPGSASPTTLRLRAEHERLTQERGEAEAGKAETPPRLTTWRPLSEQGWQARLARLTASGYINCTVEGDELHGKCLLSKHRRGNYEWARWTFGGRAGSEPPETEAAGGAGMPARAQLSWWLPRPSAATADFFDPLAFVRGVMRLGGGSHHSVVFMGDSTARQQTVSLCCLLKAGATLGAPYTWRLLVNRQFQAYRCAVTLSRSGGTLTVYFNRFNRADSFEEGRPPEMTPRLHPNLASGIASQPTLLVLNLGAWEYEDGCEPQLHSLHDKLCEAPGVMWRHWILSGYARKLGMIATALEAGYPSGSEKRNHSLVVLRTATPRDFEGGRLFVGQCNRTEPLRPAELARDEAEPDRGSMRFAVMSKNAMLLATAAQRLPWVPVLDAYSIARQRADAHPSHAVGRGADCLHYCLPGVPDVYNGRLMSLLLARLEAAGLKSGLEPLLPSPPVEGPAATRSGAFLAPSRQLLKRWNFLHRGKPFVTGEPPASYAVNVNPGQSPASVELECPLQALAPEDHHGPLLGVGMVP